jgi:hypothetical protein
MSPTLARDPNVLTKPSASDALKDIVFVDIEICLVMLDLAFDMPLHFMEELFSSHIAFSCF